MYGLSASKRSPNLVLRAFPFEIEAGGKSPGNEVEEALVERWRQWMFDCITFVCMRLQHNKPIHRTVTVILIVFPRSHA